MVVVDKKFGKFTYKFLHLGSGVYFINFYATFSST
jgi:hypothetical protein